MAGKGGDTWSALGLLVLRLGAGGLLAYGHGWDKLVHYAERSHKFADPLHVGPSVSLALAIFAELVCASLVIVGLATRYVAIPLLILFGVIVFVVHGGQPLDKRELPILYGVAFLTLALLGPGRYSIDGARGRA